MVLQGKRVLFISYNGMLDPLGQSQVIPYLKQLAGEGVKFSLLSFERSAAFSSAGQLTCQELKKTLADYNIDWHWLRYHQKPSLPSTAYDVMVGIRYAQRLVKQNGIDLIHARSHIPAVIALALKKRFGLKMIFDVRGLMAEEYVDAEHWRKGGIPYRLIKSAERRAFAQSDGIVTLTEKIWSVIQNWEGLRGRQVIHEVIPCCADLELFRFSCDDRERRRRELDSSDPLTIVYSGSIDGWYLTEEMVDFFAYLRRKNLRAHFLWLTSAKHDRIRSLMVKRGIPSSSYTLRAVSSREVPSYLSASDVGLAFIKPCFSKWASSPTKTAEYLACGLPLILNTGIGDSDALVSSEKVGALVTQFTESEYERAFDIIEGLISNAEQTRKRNRCVAEKLFDLEMVGAMRYMRLYERVLGRN